MTALLLQLAAIVLQVFGTFFVWHDTERISARNPRDGLDLSDLSKYDAWYYYKVKLGFALLFAGIILLSVALALTMNESRYNRF